MGCPVQAGVNALAWAPHSSCHICTAGDDSQALIWDLSSMSQPLDQGLGVRLRTLQRSCIVLKVPSHRLCVVRLSQQQSRDFYFLDMSRSSCQ